jgi:hypothetical protein
LEDKMSQTYQLTAINQGLRNILEVQTRGHCLRHLKVELGLDL